LIKAGFFGYKAISTLINNAKRLSTKLGDLFDDSLAYRCLVKRLTYFTNTQPNIELILFFISIL